jgi:hypothetical protein
MEEVRSGYARSFPDDELSFVVASAADEPNVVLGGVAVVEAAPRKENPAPLLPVDVEEAAVVESLDFGAARWSASFLGGETVLLAKTFPKMLAVFEPGLVSAARCFLDGVSAL